MTAAPAIPAVPVSAAEPVTTAGRGRNAGKKAEKQTTSARQAAVTEARPTAVLEQVEAAESEPPAEPVIVPETNTETVVETHPEQDKEPEPVIEVVPEAATEPVPDAAIEPPDTAAEPPQENAPEQILEPIASPIPISSQASQRPLKPQRSEEEKAAARLAARQKKLDEGSEESPFSVIVGQVYDGPLDLLLDLIRKQDIDIYDIPMAIITSQFLAYVNQLRASDVDVAGDFIYTASLLIHIKSKMLLPHTETGPEQAAEDPRRELVERLLEHERFKNAAQMLQQKQMLEAATWSNPGVREFKDDVSAEPEIAADTVDLVRIFREILERARNRPVIDVEEDSVTVGQMIQFLARRLNMEDRPVALRRLLSHTRSERALIAMFLALLEMVRLQAILLRQDRQFSEIFIKKHTGFDAVMSEGFGNARDDWR
jgi:segregation and condensation protein A